MVILYIVILIIGFIGLIKGADIFVDGSCGVARIFHVSGLIIGLTIVALGTSAPEMAVSILASIQGSNEIAVSNVIGSNLFNLLMVLGFCSIIKPLPVDDPVRKRDFPICLLSVVAIFIVTAIKVLPFKFIGMPMSDNVGILPRAAGIVLLIAFTIYLGSLVMDAMKNPDDSREEATMPMWKCIVFIIIGLVLIVAGGKAVVYGAQNLARAMGLTETLIGLTVVAIGTSLPELVTSITAAKKGETGMAVGNVVGSNIYNVMFILGISSAIHPMPVNVASVWDFAILIAICIISWIFAASNSEIRRREGIIMVASYVADMIFACLR